MNDERLGLGWVLCGRRFFALAFWPAPTLGVSVHAFHWSATVQWSQLCVPAVQRGENQGKTKGKREIRVEQKHKPGSLKAEQANATNGMMGTNERNGRA